MIEERIGEVRVRVRTDIEDAADVRPAAERMVRTVLERCAMLLEQRAPGRIVLIQRLPLHWRLEETVLDDPGQLDELARSAADAIERVAVPCSLERLTSMDTGASGDAAVVFDNEAHLRASWLLAVTRGRPAWFLAGFGDSEDGDPFAALASPERGSLARATLFRLAREGAVAEVLAARPASTVAVLAAALGCHNRDVSGSGENAHAGRDRFTGDSALVEALTGIASSWPDLMPVGRSLALRVHAAAMLDSELDAPPVVALAAAALHQISSPSRVEPAAVSVREPDQPGDSEQPEREGPAQTFVTRCAGVFYLLDRIQELDLAESLWKACLPEGAVLAAAMSALIGSKFAGDRSALLFGGVNKETPCPDISLEQHAEIALATCAALAQALPRRGLADVPSVDVMLADHSAGRLLIAAAEGSPFAFFAWPANTADLLRSGLSAFLNIWPHGSLISASPALASLDSTGRVHATHEPRATPDSGYVQLFLPPATSIAGAAVLALTVGAPSTLLAARARDTSHRVDVFVDRWFARPARIRLTHEQMDIIMDADHADPDLRRAGLDRDPGWLPWLRLKVGFVFEERRP